MKIILALFSLVFAAAAGAQEAPVAGPPVSASNAENMWNLDLSTGGRVRILLRPDIAPGHVERVKTLTNQGFYDGIVFHRVIPGFMAQTGDPTGTGQGGSELPDLKAEFTRTPHLRGTVSMARAEAEDSANSQFFIVFLPTPKLDGNYTAFGRVVSGMQHVDAIAPGEPPAQPSRIVRASLGNNVPEPSPAELSAMTQDGDAATRALQAQLPPDLSADEGAAPVPGETAAPASDLDDRIEAEFGAPEPEEDAEPDER